MAKSPRRRESIAAHKAEFAETEKSAKAEQTDKRTDTGVGTGAGTGVVRPSIMEAEGSELRNHQIGRRGSMEAVFVQLRSS